MKNLAILILCTLCTLSCSVHKGKHNKKGQKNITGTKSLPQKRYNAQKLAQTFAYKDSVDLQPYTPPVAQQTFRNCYAYASAYAGRTILYNVSHKIPVDAHPDSTIFSTGYLQKLIYPTIKPCKKNGYDTYLACQLLQDSGLVFKKDYQNECSGNEITDAMRIEALKYKVKAEEIYKPCDDYNAVIDMIKNSLNQKHPVVIGWYSTKSFNGRGYGVDCWQPTRRERKRNACHYGANHAICVIGYNNVKHGGAFQIMNSWGTKWGNGGFMWIRYNDLAQYSQFGIELSELPK